MSADVFTRRWLALFALLAVLVAIAPYFFQVVVQNSGCHDTAGACQHLDETLELYGRRVILAVVLTPLLVAVAARALTMGAFVWAVPFALLMTIGAAPLYFAAAEFAATGATVDLLAAPALTPLLFLLLLLVALSAYPDESENGMAVVWRAVLGLVAVATLFITAPAWVTGIADLPYVARYALPIATTLAGAHEWLGITPHLAPFTTYCLIAFVLAAAGLVVGREREEPARIRVMRA